MKKIVRAIILSAILLLGVAPAQAAEKLNIYIDKAALLACDAGEENIRISPEGMVQVTRCALWPWDEAGTQWSMFAELENISQEKIVIDETWLIACKANRDEIATAPYVFFATDNIMEPGERVVLHAGAYPYVKNKGTAADVALDTWDVEGLEDFAGRIRQAQKLRVRLEVRGNQSTQNWAAVEIEPKIWIENRTLHFEWTNETEETLQFHTIGAVVCDEQGQIIDVIKARCSGDAIAEPGETLRYEKELAPYVTQEMMNGASFEPYAFRFPQPQ